VRRQRTNASQGLRRALVCSRGRLADQAEAADNAGTGACLQTDEPGSVLLAEPGNDDEDIRYALDCAEARFQVALIVLPYIGQHLRAIPDLVAIVDDVIGRFEQYCENVDIADIDFQNYWHSYIRLVERGLERRGHPKVDVEWVWTARASTLKERWNQ
jgi:hypothetical protein